MTSIDEESDLFDTSDLPATTDTVSLTVELPRAMVERLKALADRSAWDVSAYVQDALADYVPHQERELTAIAEAVAELEAGAPTIPHEKMVARAKSRGTQHELPPPWK